MCVLVSSSDVFYRSSRPPEAELSALSTHQFKGLKMADDVEVDVDSIISRLLDGELGSADTNRCLDITTDNVILKALSEPLIHSIPTPNQIIITFTPPLPPSLPSPLSLHTHRCSVRGSRVIKSVQLTENEVRNLCLKSREIFLSQPILLELEAPLKICGESTHAVFVDICLLF